MNFYFPLGTLAQEIHYIDYPRAVQPFYLLKRAALTPGNLVYAGALATVCCDKDFDFPSPSWSPLHPRCSMASPFSRGGERSPLALLTRTVEKFFVLRALSIIVALPLPLCCVERTPVKQHLTSTFWSSGGCVPGR